MVPSFGNLLTIIWGVEYKENHVDEEFAVFAL